MGNDNTYITKDKNGKIVAICLETGEVISSEVQLSGDYRFDVTVAQLVCQEIREGKTIKALGNDPLFPPLSVIHAWQRKHPLFAAEIKLARKERAEYYHDSVLDIANSVDTTSTRDEIGALKFKTDQYKWAAEKGDSSSYGNKTEVSGTIDNKITMIVLNTGIKRGKPDVEVDYERRESKDTEERKVDLDKPESIKALGRAIIGGSDSEDEEEETQKETF